MKVAASVNDNLVERVSMGVRNNKFKNNNNDKTNQAKK